VSRRGDESEQTIFRPSPLQELRARQQGATLFVSSDRNDAPPGVTHDSLPPLPPSSLPPSIDEDFPDPGVARTARNPVREAATPLLALISAVRSGRIDLPLPELHRRASAAAARFDQALLHIGLDVEEQRRARYAVYATVDDVAQTLPGRGAEGVEWARRSMVVRGFGENIGGDRFWMLLADMLAHPAGHADLIELYHACLAAGFHGRHRVGNTGSADLNRTMADAYAALPHVRAVSETELVPAWRGRPTPRRTAGAWAPLLLAASVLAGGLLVLLLVLRLILGQTGQPALAAMAAINPQTPLRLSRRADAAAQPTSAQQSRIAGLLAPEIAQHLVTLDEDANSVRVRTTIGQLFRSGSDVLEPGRQALFERIARAVAQERGAIRIEGHADSDPVTSLAFPDNQALSDARAQAVATVFRGLLPDPKRVSSQGFGATRPIATNATAAGKALNRRVEIVVPRTE